MTGDVEVRRLDLQDLASVREFADSVDQRRRADQQRRHHGGAVRDHQRRLREPDRHQPPRPLRVDQPAAAQDHRPGGDGVLVDAPGSAGSASRTSTGRPGRTRRGWPTASPSWPTCCSPASCSGASTAAGSSLTAHAAHPGYSATNLQGHTGNRIGTPVLGLAANRLFATSAEFGASPTLYAASADLPPNSFIGPEVRRRAARSGAVGRSPLARDAKTARALWQLSEQLTGTEFPLLEAAHRLPLATASRRGWSGHRYRRGFAQASVPAFAVRMTHEGRSIRNGQRRHHQQAQRRGAHPDRQGRLAPGPPRGQGPRGPLRPRRRSAAPGTQRPRLRRGAAPLRHQRRAEPGHRRHRSSWR